MKVLSPKKLKETIGFKPHKAQKQILKEMRRFTVICAGRRFGKTILTAYLALKFGLLANKRIWIVAPTYGLSEKTFEYLTTWISNYFPKRAFKVNFTTLTLECPFGSKIVCKSSENPTSLLGESLDLLILDEASRIRKDIWESNLRPSLSDREGKLVAISTPLSKANWFHKLYTRGIQEKKNPNGDWISFLFSSMENPMLIQRDLDEAKSTLPEAVWKQEYLAEFLDSAYSVFRGVRDCISPDLPRPIDLENRRASQYILGIDLAKMNDFSVVVVANFDTNEIVHIDRWQKIPYTLQKKRIISIAEAYRPSKIIVDSGGIGGSISDDLRSALGQLAVTDFALVGTISKDFKKKGSKQLLIEHLAQRIEAKEISLPANEILIGELESYGMELSEKGNVTYSAPQGQFDDCVIALALAVWGLKTEETKKRIRRMQMMQNQNRRFRNFQYD
jgi:hypothetical protein